MRACVFFLFFSSSYKYLVLSTGSRDRMRLFFFFFFSSEFILVFLIPLLPGPFKLFC